MGEYGKFANLVALIYDVFLVIWLSFPPEPNPNAAAFNWGPVIFLAMTVIAMIFYFVAGRHQYRDPRTEVIG